MPNVKKEMSQKETPTSQVGVSENGKRHGNDAIIEQNRIARLRRVNRLSVFDTRREHLARAQFAVLTLHAEEIEAGEALANGAINTVMGPDLCILRSRRDVMEIVADLAKEAAA